MPESLKISGGIPLGGEIHIAGSKNAVLPAIAAALLTDEEVILENVPEITDVAIMLALAQSLGVAISRDPAAKTISIRANHLSGNSLDEELSRKLRASLLFSGTLLSRTRRVAIAYPGGDRIGARPLTTHLNALRSLGAIVREEDQIYIDGGAAQSGVVILEEPSVTATENTLLAAALLPGTTEIRLAAAEPHIQELMKLLTAMGAPAYWRGVGVIAIEGQKKLSGVRYRINPDELELSSFSALAAATRSEILIRDFMPEYSDALLLQLTKMGVEYRLVDAALLIEKPTKPYHGFRLQSGLYPKLVSDHLPPFAVLATQSEGESLIHEWLYDGRLRYVEELNKMGASATILDPHRAIITGPTPLYGKEISSLDVRSGMTLIIAALVAQGESILNDVDHIDRGYERIDERLRALGAAVERITVNG